MGIIVLDCLLWGGIHSHDEDSDEDMMKTVVTELELPIGEQRKSRNSQKWQTTSARRVFLGPSKAGKIEPKRKTLSGASQAHTTTFCDRTMEALTTSPSKARPYMYG
jgi:hypothetical protein